MTGDNLANFNEILIEIYTFEIVKKLETILSRPI